MTFREDLECSEEDLSVMFAVEVQQLLQDSRDAELKEVQLSYGIDDEIAAMIIESTSRICMSELVNKGLAAISVFKERDALVLLKRMLRYAKYITTGTVEGDGGNFKQSHKDDLIACYANEVRAGTDPEILALEAQGDQAQRLRDLIELNPEYLVPYDESWDMEGNDISDAWGE